MQLGRQLLNPRFIALAEICVPQAGKVLGPGLACVSCRTGALDIVGNSKIYVDMIYTTAQLALRKLKLHQGRDWHRSWIDTEACISGMHRFIRAYQAAARQTFALHVLQGKDRQWGGQRAVKHLGLQTAAVTRTRTYRSTYQVVITLMMMYQSSTALHVHA